MQPSDKAIIHDLIIEATALLDRCERLELARAAYRIAQAIDALKIDGSEPEREH